MANYEILFKSLRNGRDYTLSIGGSTGNAVRLYGAAQPFVTDEDNSEDIFTPMRTQSGYVRIIDTGHSVPVGNTQVSVDWTDIIPAKDTDRPVMLTHVEGGTTIYDWVGFLQTQTFDGPLYDMPTEREFPVQCVLQALDSVPVDYLANGESSIVNFFGLIAKAFAHIPAAIVGNFIIQGKTDAETWLKSKFDWQNLFNETNGGLTPKYSYKQALEDMCRFWGFTMRTSGRDIYFTQSGATDVLGKLTLTFAQVQNMAAGGTGGTVANDYYTNKLSGTDFASTEQDIVYLLGYNNIIVKADCNKKDIGVDFAPEDVEKALEQNATWAWMGEQDSQVGYFYTNPPKASFLGTTLAGTGGSYGQFGRVQIFGNEEDVEPIQADVIYLTNNNQGGVKASIETLQDYRFGVGSIEMSGDIYWGHEQKTFQGSQFMNMKIGIGTDRANAKWYYLTKFVTNTHESIVSGWFDTEQDFRVFPKSGKLCPGVIYLGLLPYTKKFAKIPITENMTGRLFIDFYASSDGDYGIGNSFMIANFKAKFSRDEIVIPNTWASAPQARTVSTERQSSCEYKDAEWGKNDSNWSADCIYASDNNMEYGLGLLMDGNRWLDTVSYNGVAKRPEEHLAASVVNFWKSKRTMNTLELQYNSVGDVRPDNTVDGAYPVSISHDWRDDIIKISMII